MNTRVERDHSYRFWVPNGYMSGVVVADPLCGNGSVRVTVDCDDGTDAQDGKPQTMTIPNESVPAVIAALTSYHARLDAAENEKETA